MFPDYEALADIISIHALREESDLLGWHVLASKGIFQSTLSVRRATCREIAVQCEPEISIHALREESDARLADCPEVGAFQSTLSVRRATTDTDSMVHRHTISIHALREESDGRYRC